MPAASLYAAAQGSLGQQGGGGGATATQGGGLNVLGYLLLGTLALLALSGFVVTVIRARNVQQQLQRHPSDPHAQRDDSPPEPRVL